MPSSIKKRFVINFGVLLLLSLSVPLLVNLVQQAQKYFTKASILPANIVVDAGADVGPFPDSWRSFAQGGEEDSPYTFTPVVDLMRDLGPKYIRIDHLFDFYDIVSQNPGGGDDYNFNKLDVVVGDILNMGALPFFSLSYTPPVFTSDGNVTSVPKDWSQWQTLIQKTIEHYSGADGLNLSEVYYEVWNEPDLFGRFEAGRNKDYLNLYLYSAKGAQAAQNTNKYYFGGPATTGAYSAWFSSLIAFSQKNQLPLDFLSWHYYGKDLTKLDRDITMVDSILAQYPNLKVQKIISEWGIDSEINPVYDTKISGTYTLAGYNRVLNKLNYIFAFSVKDGKDPNNKELWGRWGLIGHEAAGKIEKPRYRILKMMNELAGNQLSLQGEGSNVGGFAAKDQETLKILLYNYDLNLDNYESVPVTVLNLPKGFYNITTSLLSSQNSITEDKTVSNGTLTTQVILTPNEVAILAITKTGSLTSFTQGRDENPKNQSYELVGMNELPNYNFPDAVNDLLSVNFWFKPYWSASDNTVSYPLFTTIGAGGQSLQAIFTKEGETAQLVFSLFLGGEEQIDGKVVVPLENWIINSWHNLGFTFGFQTLVAEIDGISKEINLPLPLLPQKNLSFDLANGSIDDLFLKSGGQVILQKSFDGSLDK